MTGEVEEARETKDICQRLGVRDSSHPKEKGNYKADGQRLKFKDNFGNLKPQAALKYMQGGREAEKRKRRKKRKEKDDVEQKSLAKSGIDIKVNLTIYSISQFHSGEFNRNDAYEISLN